jgi:hypothetical protein
MKKFFLALLISQTLFAGAVISVFTGEPGYNQVKLKWIVTAESNVKGYQILRSFDNLSYENIAFVQASASGAGEKTYSYIDKTVFKPNGRVCYYKLGIVDSGTESVTRHEKTVVVSPQISAARHTWGSIKAMFR